jgi:hypothetical protein
VTVRSIGSKAPTAPQLPADSSSFPTVPLPPAHRPPSNRLAHGLYPLLEEASDSARVLVSPFRLPREIEVGLWEPRRYLPVLPGTAGSAKDPVD